MIYPLGEYCISCSSGQGCLRLRPGRISPAYFIENNRRIESKERPSCSIPLLLVILHIIYSCDSPSVVAVLRGNMLEYSEVWVEFHNS